MHGDQAMVRTEEDGAGCEVRGAGERSERQVTGNWMREVHGTSGWGCMTERRVIRLIICSGKTGKDWEKELAKTEILLIFLRSGDIRCAALISISIDNGIGEGRGLGRAVIALRAKVR